MKKLFFILILAIPAVTFSQNLTGTWEGSGGGVTYIKLVVKHIGDSLYGYTYDEGGGFCKATFFARYYRKDKKVVGRGGRILLNSGTHALADYDWNYSKEPGGEYLRESSDEDDLFDRFFGSPQYLKKTSNKTDIPPRIVPAKPNRGIVKSPAPAVTQPKKIIVTPKPAVKPPVAKIITKPPVKPPVKSPVKPPVAKPAPVITKKVVTADTVKKQTAAVRSLPVAVPALIKLKEERSSKLVETIYTTTDTVKMLVYDNGEVDGDTVTVFFDNKIVLDKYRISDKAKEISLPVSKNGDKHSIELFANNLGTIPPNTALIIIVAGGKRHELRASYDLNTNARIVIQYKP